MCLLNFICLCGVAMAIVLNPLKMLINMNVKIKNDSNYSVW